jgi:hypothetical protein
VVIIAGFPRRTANPSAALRVKKADKVPHHEVPKAEPASKHVQKVKNDVTKKRVMEVISGMPDGKITNFDLQILLDISESAAKHSLEDLVKEGKIRKMEMEGKLPYYERIL